MKSVTDMCSIATISTTSKYPSIQSALRHLCFPEHCILLTSNLTAILPSTTSNETKPSVDDHYISLFLLWPVSNWNKSDHTNNSTMKIIILNFFSLCRVFHHKYDTIRIYLVLRFISFLSLFFKVKCRCSTSHGFYRNNYECN